MASANVSPKKVTNSKASGSPCRIEPRARYSIFCRDSSRMVRSSISTAAGRQARASSVASMAACTEAKWPTPMTVCRGVGTRRTVASTTVTRVPSDPTTSFARSSPDGAAADSARRSSR